MNKLELPLFSFPIRKKQGRPLVIETKNYSEWIRGSEASLASVISYNLFINRKNLDEQIKKDDYIQKFEC